MILSVSCLFRSLACFSDTITLASYVGSVYWNKSRSCDRAREIRVRVRGKRGSAVVAGDRFLMRVSSTFSRGRRQERYKLKDVAHTSFFRFPSPVYDEGRSAGFLQELSLARRRFFRLLPNLRPHRLRSRHLRKHKTRGSLVLSQNMWRASHQ